MYETKDVTYHFVVLGLWANVEIALCIICGCLPVLPRFFQILKPNVLDLFRACNPMQFGPQRLGFCGVPRERGKVDRSTFTPRGPYELQGENHVDESYISNHTERETSTVNSADGRKTRSLASSSKLSRAGNEDVEAGPKNNQILKTVVIETIRDRRRSSDLNVEVQLRDLGW